MRKPIAPGAVVALITLASLASCSRAMDEVPVTESGQAESPVEAGEAVDPYADGWHYSVFDTDELAAGEPENQRWEPVRSVEPSEVSGFQLILEFTQYPDQTEATEEQQARAEELRRRSFDSARRHGWFDFETAVGDGYDLMFADLTHYVNEEFIADGRILDPERPEFLLFYDSENGKQLVAFMYLAAARDEHGPQIGGPLTVWHNHLLASPLCFLHDLFYVAAPGSDGRCERGVPSHVSPEMLHVWFVDHPEGEFATRMELPAATRAAFEGPGWPPQQLP